MRKILDNEDESNAKNANAKALEDIEKAERDEERETKSREPDGPITVEVPDEEEEEAVKEASGRNVENRRNRYREQKEGREKAERERDEERRRREDLETQLRTYQQQPPTHQQQTQEPQKNPYVEQEAKIRQAIRDLSETFDNLRPEAQKDPATRKRFTDQYAELQSTQQKLNALIATGGSSYSPQAEQQRNMQMMLTARYPDVMGKDDYYRFADATYNRLRATGAPDNWETIDKAMEETRRQFRLGKAPPPSAATKARFSGVSSGSGGTASKTGPTKVELTKEHRTMARAAFPKLKEKDAYKEFAKLLSKEGAEA